MAELDFSALRAIGSKVEEPSVRRPSTTPEAVFRTAFDYYKRHNPPVVDHSYWKTHIVGADFPPPAEREYWEKAAKDMIETASAQGENQLVRDLLVSVYSELEREYKRLRDSAR